MNEKYLRVLELDKILDRLASYTAFSASEALAHALVPSADPAEIVRRQKETTEARALLDQHPEIGIGGARNVRPLTRNARLGSLLAPSDLLEIRQTLLSARALHRTLARLGELYPLLATRAAQLAEAPAVADAIARAVNDRGEVVDTASPELARIRHDLAVLRERLMDRLQRIVTSPSYTKIVQEPIVTQREGRYVIPVRAEARGRLPGIVHDTSASGATLFVEPLVVLEMGNRARELEREEAHEVERILRELTVIVAEHADAIDMTVQALAEFDLALAKAKYSVEINGAEPEFADVGSQAKKPTTRAIAHDPLSLFDARHPLLDPATVVPISISLGGAFSILVITGPNTGGKTVTLKTVGLLALMAQCGLHIPAREGSILPVYDGVYPDIGDEQSIEQSLSTFSSHLRNLVEILQQADERSLVLLDELGAGTDPVEGSALARAILSHLLERRIPALVATHFAELKAFAHSTPGVQNASVEFDVVTLSPTYQLTIGLPGRSNAFAIASRLGLDPGIIERARTTLDRGDVELEAMLTQIRDARQEAASAQAHGELARREAERLAAEAKKELAAARKLHSDIGEQARRDAQAEIELAREELNRLRQEWRRVSLTREFVENEEAKLDAISEQLSAVQPERQPLHSERAASSVPETISVGDQVWVERLGQTGHVVAIDAQSALVQVGPFRVHLKVDELGEKMESAGREEAGQAGRIALPKVESPGVEISLRGMRADDALERLDKYIDRAYMAGLPYVRIVHGKGTGTLRKLARDLLREHPLVAEIHAAEPHEGGDGVTIAKLVSR